MNLKEELFLNRNPIIKGNKKIRFEGLQTMQNISNLNPNLNQNKIKMRYSKKSKERYFQKNTYNNDRIINNILTPPEKSYFTESNQSQVNRDIYGYNNYIINKNNFNTINFSGKKSYNHKSFGINNFSYLDTPNYLTAYESSSDLNSIYPINNRYLIKNPNNSNYSPNNNDINFMNMKLNFKILQQKLSHLKDIAASNDMNCFKSPYKKRINDNEYLMEDYPIKVLRTVGFSNKNKLKKYMKTTKNNEELELHKTKKEQNYLINNNKRFKKINIVLNQYNNKNDSTIKNENDLFRARILKNENEYIKDRYYTNDNSFYKSYQKDESELSQIADNILEMNKSIQDLKDNYFMKDEPLKIQKFQSKNNNIIKKVKDNIKNKNKKNKYRQKTNDIEICYNKEYNQTQNNNDKNFKLIIEHIISYDASENKKTITEKNSEESKKNNQNKNINIVQTNNFILNNLTEQRRNKNTREESPRIENNYTDINIKSTNISNKNNLQSFNDDNDDDDGDKIINSLIATASQNLKNLAEEKKMNNSITDFDNNFTKDIPSNMNHKKTLTFDDNLIYINYHQDYKVSNLRITDSENKAIQYNPKDISKYLKKLKSNNFRLKPIIINSNKIAYNNIINKIKIKNTNSKINKIKTNQTIQKNKDFIKNIQKKNNSKERSKSKEKNKNNSINLNDNKSKINKDKILLKKK